MGVLTTRCAHPAPTRVRAGKTRAMASERAIFASVACSSTWMKRFVSPARGNSCSATRSMSCTAFRIRTVALTFTLLCYAINSLCYARTRRCVRLRRCARAPRTCRRTRGPPDAKPATSGSSPASPVKSDLHCNRAAIAGGWLSMRV